MVDITELSHVSTGTLSVKVTN